MAKQTRKPLTDTEREERRRAERELLTSAVAQLKTSDGWLAWLRVRKAFRTYSMTNQLLIAMQNPNATRVAGFQKWLTLGRCVRKGEKAIRIFAPVPPSKKKLDEWRAAGSDPKERPRTLFKLASVFDVSQVDKLPPPAEVAELDAPFDLTVAGDELAELIEPDGPLHALAAELGYSLSFPAREGGGSTHGYCDPRARRIVVFADTTANSQAATAVHELAHALVRVDRQDADPVLDYAREELVAESVAYSVLASLGIDAGTSSIPYLASWSQTAPIETIEQHAKLIDRLAKRIEDAVLPSERGDVGRLTDKAA